MSQTLETNANSRRSGTARVPEALVAALWLILGLWSWTWLGPTWVAAMRPEPDQIIDFYQDWGSAHNYWSDLPIYTPHSTSIPRYLGLPSNPMPSIEYNIHPPTSVLLALPLGQLNYPDAVLIWNVISLAALLASLVIMAVALPVPQSLFLPGLALLPFCLPVLGNLQMGQLTPILVLLVTVIWALERSGRSSTAGLLLGTAAAIKLFPAYLAVYYLVRGQVRPLVAALLFFLALTLMTAWVLGVDTYHHYVQVVLPTQDQFESWNCNLSIGGLWNNLFYPLHGEERGGPLWHGLTLARWGTLFSDLAITAIIGIFTHRAQTQSQRDLAFAITGTAMLLISPLTWDISLLLLFVPITIIACSTVNTQSGWMPTALVVIVLIVWLPQPILTSLVTAGRTINVAPPSFLLGAAPLKFYALLGTLALGLAALHTDMTNIRRGATSGATAA